MLPLTLTTTGKGGRLERGIPSNMVERGVIDRPILEVFWDLDATIFLTSIPTTSPACSFYPKTYLNSPGMSLPQGLCTCSSLCLECYSPGFLCGSLPLSLWSPVRCVPSHTLTPIHVHTFCPPLLPTSHFLSNPLPYLLFFCSIHKSPDNACFTCFCYHLPPPNTFP